MSGSLRTKLSLLARHREKVKQQKEQIMSVESHIKSLQTKHAELEASLSAEIARPNPDFYTVKDIKKQKLIVKEEIARLMRELNVKQSAS